MRGALLCIPFRCREPLFYPDTVIISTDPTPEPPPAEPPAPAGDLIQLAQQLGSLQTAVSQLTEQMQQIQPRLEMLESEDRWTSDRISSLAEEVYRGLMRVEEQIETLQQEEHQEEQEEPAEDQSQIPALPPQEQQTQQPPPEPETKKRPWFL